MRAENFHSGMENEILENAPAYPAPRAVKTTSTTWSCVTEEVAMGQETQQS